ncbi:MAG: cytosolic protein [Armatimonadetes bacterium]|nr:cytosolic protein [Armatimonadota bacterium]
MASRRNFDSPWKTILEALFPEFLQLFVPEAYDDIDWNVRPRFLDKEFDQATRGARAGSRAVDQLAEVALRDGSQTWVLVHIEVQAQRDRAFARRMYRYHLRIFDRFDREPVSLAVLADAEPGWRPTGFGYTRWRCSARLDYPVVKLTDWADRPEELFEGGNPFGIAVAAHLAAVQAGRQPETRFARRKALYRDMRRMGVSQDQASALMTFMDWVLELPEELDDRFWSEVGEEEDEPNMKYMSRFEMKAMERGRREGLLEGLQLGLELRFGKPGLEQMEELSRIDSLETLMRVKDALTTVSSPAELRRVYAL